MTQLSSYRVCFDMLQKHPGTGSQMALAKAFLSMDGRYFSLSEIFGSLDPRHAAAVTAMIIDYGKRNNIGEYWDCKTAVENQFPELVDIAESRRRSERS